MSDINKAVLRGRAMQDASVKHLTNSTLVTLRIATDGSYQGKDGRMVERVDYHNVACWGKVGEQAQGIRKGDVVAIKGAMRTRSYYHQNGTAQKWITEVVADRITVDAQECEPQVERDDVPDRSEDEIPF